ncbi:MAG: M20 family metallopeptidase [Bulleidia sp.]
MTVMEEIHALRKEIHSHPEPGNQEFHTAEVIEAYLQRYGIETKRVLDTAVIGILRCGAGGKTAALRADMDALPVSEKTGCTFSSQNAGYMHACGHDVHTAALLGCAALLSKEKNTLKGTVIFIFQPDEEGNGGAKRLIEAGVLDGVDAVFGCHVAPDLPSGTVGIRYGKFYAASDMYDVTMTGRASHGAQPEQGIDALVSAADAVCAISKIAESENDRCVVSTGMLHSGTVRNTIADSASFSGIIRSLGPDNRSRLKQRVEQCIRDACAKTGAEWDLKITESYGGIVNTEAETDIVRKAAEQAVGKEHVVVIEEPLMTTEDFGCYVDQVGGSFYHIGAGCTFPLHSPYFLPDEKALETAVRMHVSVVETFLG